MADFFVNTASTPGGDGTTNATVGANRAFASSREAVTSSGLDISAPRIVFCTAPTGVADTLSITQVQWDSLNTTPTNYVRFVGDWPGGEYSTSHYRMEVTNSDCIYNNTPGHVRIEQFQVKINVTDSGNDYVGIRLSTQNVGIGRTDCDCRISRCLVVKTGAGTSIVYAYYNSPYAETNGGLIRLWNNAALNCNYGYGAAWNQVTNYNNTARGSTISDFVDAQVCINCLAATDNGIDDSGGFNSVGSGGGLSDYNASADGSATQGTHSRANQTFTFVQANDVAISPLDAGAVGWGVTNPASGLFLDDITGTTRTGAWDIGASQHESAAEVTINTTNLTAANLTIG